MLYIYKDLIDLHYKHFFLIFEHINKQLHKIAYVWSVRTSE